MDTSYNTDTSPKFYEPINYKDNDFSFAGTNAEGYLGSGWFGQDVMTISSYTKKTGDSNGDITNNNVGAGETDPAMFLIIKSLTESNWIPAGADLSNFGGFIGLGQTPTTDSYAASAAKVMNVFWKTIYGSAWTA
jgi:hypothetical protein